MCDASSAPIMGAVSELAIPWVLYTDGCIRASQTARVSHTDGGRRVLEALAGGAAALVEFRLETGRTHQASLSFYTAIDYHCPY